MDFLIERTHHQDRERTVALDMLAAWFPDLFGDKAPLNRVKQDFLSAGRVWRDQSPDSRLYDTVAVKATDLSRTKSSGPFNQVELRFRTSQQKYWELSVTWLSRRPLVNPDKQLMVDWTGHRDLMGGNICHTANKFFVRLVNGGLILEGFPDPPLVSLVHSAAKNYENRVLARPDLSNGNVDPELVAAQAQLKTPARITHLDLSADWLLSLTYTNFPDFGQQDTLALPPFVTPTRFS